MMDYPTFSADDTLHNLLGKIKCKEERSAQYLPIPGTTRTRDLLMCMWRIMLPSTSTLLASLASQSKLFSDAYGAHSVGFDHVLA